MFLLEKLKLRASLLFPVAAVCLVERFLEFFSSLAKYDSLTVADLSSLGCSTWRHGRFHRTIKR